MTNFLEPRKIPQVWKITALLRLHRLDGAIVAHEEFTFAIRLFEQRKPLAIRAHPRVPLNKFRLGQTKMSRNARDLSIGQSHLPRPATTRRTTLTLMENWHGDISGIKAHPRNLEARAVLNQARMNRFFQFSLITSFIAFSWLAFMVVHEFGHVLTAWITGGSVDRVVLHPLQISWTALAKNPHPQLVAWGGAVWGTVLPASLLVLAARLRSPGLYLFRFFAGFCLIANGLYLFVDSFGGAGDGGTLIYHGAPQWELLMFGVITVPCGFWLWHGLGLHFGLGASRRVVSKPATFVSIALLMVTVGAELVAYTKR